MGGQAGRKEVVAALQMHGRGGAGGGRDTGWCKDRAYPLGSRLCPKLAPRLGLGLRGGHWWAGLGRVGGGVGCFGFIMPDERFDSTHPRP